MFPKTHREIEVCLARHDQTPGLNAGQAVRKGRVVTLRRKPWLPDERDVPRLPGVQKCDKVIRVPRPEEAALPVGADEVVQGRVHPVHQIPVLTEPLPTYERLVVSNRVLIIIG